MEISELKEKLKREMTIDGVINKRYYHSLEVCKMALKLEEHYHFGVSKEKLAIAGILHDCAKLKRNDVLWKYLERTETKEIIEELKQFPQIWHSFVGKTVAKEDYHINDDDILSAIYSIDDGIDHGKDLVSRTHFYFFLFHSVIICHFSSPLTLRKY